MVSRIYWLVAVVLTACAQTSCPPDLEPLDPRISGPVIADPVGGPVRVECRGLVRDQCEIGFSAAADMAERFADRELDRMVVSCIGMCTPAGGKFRIDAVFAAGDPENVGAGAYGEFSGDCVAQ